MRKIVECIPNFSEGTRKDVVEKILSAIKNCKGVHIIDYAYDSDYNRLVVTLLGSPQDVKIAALASSEVAVELIDMEKHKGQHPRVGAVDVVPFVPLENVTMEECVQIAREYGKELADKLNVPVYLYGQAAPNPERSDLDYIRHGEYEELKTAILEDPKRKPDFGPSKLHPTAGATCAGAREAMVGFNVNLGTSDLEIAKKVAKALHSKKGGLTYVKAMGTKLAERNMTQIGMSITDYSKTPVYRTLELIKIEASRYGVDVVGSEFCGVVPIDALIDVARFYLRLDKFGREQVIEIALWELEKQYGEN
jgi:glutamate formiminotransferase